MVSKAIKETLRIIGQMAKMPHKPLKKRKLTKGKGRVRVGKSGG